MDIVEQFNYKKAFSRNIGWISEDEQQTLQSQCVAIAGLGGVGGSHLLTLTRLGIGKFHIADFDEFEIHNFNRQSGAFISTVGQKKVNTLVKLAKDINPNLEIITFNNGVTKENLNEFLLGVDIYIDGLDFFALNARRMVFARCHALKIPTVTAAPLGMGTAVLNFLPGKMSFEEYFQLEGHEEREQLVRFLVGLSPAMLQRAYLIDKSTVDFLNHKGPSTAMSCELCAGVAGTQALKILLGRGNVLAAPWGMQFDAYGNKFAKTWRPGGNRHPLQKIALYIAKKIIFSRKENQATLDQTDKIENERIDDITPLVKNIIAAGIRAPSGDNCQPWKFNVISDTELLIRISEEENISFFDVDHAATYISVGAVIKNMQIAAMHFLSGFEYTIENTPTSSLPQIRIKLTPQSVNTHQNLDIYHSMLSRTVNRRPFLPSSLPQATWDELLQDETPTNINVIRYNNKNERKKWVEAIKAADVIRWSHPNIHQELFNKIRLSHTKAEALGTGLEIDRLGAGPGAKYIMSFLSAWPRMQFINKAKAAHFLAEQTAFLAKASSGLVAVWVKNDTAESWIKAGEVIEQLWINAHRLGLSIQPLPVAAYMDRRIQLNPNDELNNKFPREMNTISQVLGHFRGQAGMSTCTMLFRIGKALPMKNKAIRKKLPEFLE